jgi:hypothetical protein
MEPEFYFQWGSQKSEPKIGIPKQGQEVTQQTAGATREREGGASRGRREAMQQQASTKRGQEGGAPREWQEAMTAVGWGGGVQ